MKMNILLLEDNVTDADLTQRGLTGSLPGCKVEIAQTLKQAQELIEKGIPFDLALLDMNLPDGNGLDLLMSIRQSELNIPVIILTGSGNEEVAVAALKAGASDYVIKGKEYLSKLPGIIHFVMVNHRKNKLAGSEITKVLYIEHHASDIDLTRRHISQYAPGIHLTDIPTAEEALELLPVNEAEPCPWKVILIDYRLPGINALEFIKIIRQERNLSVPIILITGHGNEELAIQSLKLGANEYLVKRENYLYRLPSLIISTCQHYELIKKQAALAESEEKYRHLFANNPQPMWIFDVETLAFLEVNDAAIQHYGYSQEEFSSMTIKDIRPSEDVETLFKSLEKSENAYDQFTGFRHLKKNGELIQVEIVSHSLTYKHRKARHIMVNDVTRRKQAEKELRKLSSAVEQSTNSIIITGIDGTIEYINPITLKLTGYTSEELIGQKPGIFGSGEISSEYYQLLWNTILSGKEWEGEFHNKRKNGELFWESVTISPIMDENGKILHFLAIKKDVTESKKQALELIAAKKQAEESDRLKSAFLANMSHEIRTPLNSIIGFSELLNDPDFEAGEKKRFVDHIVRNGNNLLNIISDIVEISKMESGEITIRNSKLEVNYFMNEIQSQYTYLVNEKRLQFKRICRCHELKDDFYVMADKERLVQVFNNLINNSLKFTAEGFIEIGCKPCGKMIEFHVKDSGIGIPIEFHERIFDRFRQVEGEKNRKFGGNGLGLAISKNLVELMGGKIWVDSEPDKGSTFYFTIPCIQ